MSVSNSRQPKGRTAAASAINAKRKKKGLPFCNREEEMLRLQVEDIVNLEPVKLPNEVTRDTKKLARFLDSVEGAINKIISGLK